MFPTIHPAFADKSEGGLGLGFILLHLRALDPHQKQQCPLLSRKCSLAAQYFLFTLCEETLAETIVYIRAGLSSSTKIAGIAAADSSNNTQIACIGAAVR